MIFSSTIFVFGFLPCLLIFYFLVPFRFKNSLLLLASLFFYAWGELVYTLLMLVSITWNYFLGRIIDRAVVRRKRFLFAGVSVNLLILAYFKYTNFIVENINTLLDSIGLSPIVLDPVHLPLGISFFTFQAISYLVDVYRRESRCQHNILTLGLYISMFPQLIAGPIVRYGTVAGQLVFRTVSLAAMEKGILRFVYGLAKKLLIANAAGEVADALFALPPDQLSALSAWCAVAAYTLQIYFDFSGYSDMAIGLGLMLGFNFPENFNYPYIARNIRDFWKRWHMSLTQWLKDYLYIPMGGSRVPPARIAFNLFTVFLLCGLWHGASWNFIVWGGWHGMFILLERRRFGRLLSKTPGVIQHIYLLIVVMIGWVFFRAEDLSQAFSFLSALGGANGLVSELHPLQLYLSGEFAVAAVCGVILATPIFPRIQSRVETGLWGFFCRLSLLSFLLAGIFMKISSGTYNPFLYFRF